MFSVVNDPLGQGFVDSLARPGRNITGFSYVDFAMIGKWLEMLIEIAPGLKRVALMSNPQTAPYYSRLLREFGGTATLHAELSEIPVRDAAEIETAIAKFGRDPGGGVIVGPESIHQRSAQFDHVIDGAVSVACDLWLPPVCHGRCAHLLCTGRHRNRPPLGFICRSHPQRPEKPADLPVQAPTKYELVINVKTAKALGLEESRRRCSPAPTR